MDSYHILYTVDHAYFPHMLTSLYSLMENNKERNFIIHIIWDEFTDDDFEHLHILNRLYEQCTIKLYPFDQLKAVIKWYNLPSWKGSDMPNARLFASKIIEGVDHLLYLDSDTVIVDSLDELFQRKIDTPIAAVQELVVPSHMQGVVDTYYNSGVLLFDCKLWEQLCCLENIYDHIKNIPIQLIYPDQDILNLGMAHQITSLPICYNMYPILSCMKNYPVLAQKFFRNYFPSYSYDEIFKSPFILHAFPYLHAKVWENNKIHPFTSYYDKYRLLWDDNFVKMQNDAFFANSVFASYMYIVSKVFHFHVPSKIKEKCNSFLKK